jgi:hypothetical protein
MRTITYTSTAVQATAHAGRPWVETREERRKAEIRHNARTLVR